MRKFSVRECLTACFAAGVLGLSACAAAIPPGPPSGPVAVSPVAATVHPASFMTGVFTPGVPDSYAPVSAFAAETGVKPRLVLWYPGLDDFPAAFADTVAAHGQLPVMQVNPGRVSMAAVAAGWIDGWADRFAAEVRAYGKPVVIGFASEANGSWDQWGRGHTAPAEWVAAWRHIVTLFRHDGANNVIWLWTINAVNLNATKSSPGPWWPGASFVTWVGIDGYYYFQNETWASVFGSTIADVRQFTSLPVLVSETAVTPSPAAPAQIAGLYAGARAAGALGVIWENETVDNPPYHLRNALSVNPSMLAAYKIAAR
jgi:hypothetical protein